MPMAGRLRAIAPYLVVLALAAVLFHIASGFTYARSGNRLGPDVWPRAILALTMVACVVRIGRVLWRGDGVPAPDATPGAEPSEAAIDESPAADVASEAAPRLYPLRLYAGIAATALYVLLMSVLGFALATAVYIAAMCRIGDYRRWTVIVPTAVVGSLAFMFVFQRVVYVSLPLGTPPFDAVALFLMRVMGIR